MTKVVEGSRLPIAAVDRIVPEMHGGAGYAYLTSCRTTQRYIEHQGVML
jgi:hypothetical protein